MANKWKEIWEKRSANQEALSDDNFEKVFLELKRMNGFDIKSLSSGEGVEFTEYLRQYRQIKKELEFSAEGKVRPMESLFEVGCGSGANLYLGEREGLEVGGIDYSESLIKIAKGILKKPKELICDEAIRLSSEIKYDAVLSNSVFSYFEDYDYAWEVLEIMYEKANYSIGIIDIHDMDKKDDFITYRKNLIEDYEIRYRGLPKLFYDRAFFLDFAKKHGLHIRFQVSDIKGYWNNDFVFSCFLLKNR